MIKVGNGLYKEIDGGRFIDDDCWIAWIHLI